MRLEESELAALQSHVRTDSSTHSTSSSGSHSSPLTPTAAHCVMFVFREIKRRREAGEPPLRLLTRTH